MYEEAQSAHQKLVKAQYFTGILLHGQKTVST